MMFSGLLDTLAGQFYKRKRANCTGNSFAGQLRDEASDFFSVTIICEDLDNMDVFAVLSDDSLTENGRNSFTFVIFVDCKKIEGDEFKVLFSLILAHEICHFAFYYELFTSLGGKANYNVYDNFKKTISGTFEEGITPKKRMSRYRSERHNISELIYWFGMYPDEHFASKNKTEINYNAFFFHFLGHLKFGKLLKSIKTLETQQKTP